ncbi:hypothetical protein FXO38_06221, partial [Capsicum annuum]
VLEWMGDGGLQPSSNMYDDILFFAQRSGGTGNAAVIKQRIESLRKKSGHETTNELLSVPSLDRANASKPFEFADLVNLMESDHDFRSSLHFCHLPLNSYMQAYSPSSTSYNTIQSMNQFAGQILSMKQAANTAASQQH